MLGFAYPGQTYPAGYPFVPGGGPPPWAYGDVLHFEAEAMAGPRLAIEALAGAELASGAIDTMGSFAGEALGQPRLAGEAVSGPIFANESMRV